ncbi:MAG: hypothetical protein GXP31_05690 [Kiritimatiellaeota bacterium]|nr:hypothetical protein [Kiritimatiellota bacterium]
MDSRERTFLTLNHEVPDRIPIDFWASAGTKEKIRSGLHLSYDGFLDEYGVDLRYIAGPGYIGPPLDTAERGTSVDIWGVPRKRVALPVDNAVEYYEEVSAAPLSGVVSVDDVERYEHWPSPDWFDYSVIASQCDEVLRRDKVVVFMGDRLNRIAQLKPAMYLCGGEALMIHMATAPAVAHAVFAKIRRFYLEYTTRILEAADGRIDIVVTGDDFGAQTNLLVSPNMWREFLEDGFRRYIDLIKSAGARVMHHTCGAVAPLIPRLIENGLDILQSLQPEAAGMSGEALKRHYGDRLCFQGGVSIQQTMPYGDAEAIRGEVRTLAQTLGRGGGYIFCTAHNIQADTSLENILTLLRAYHEFGACP